MPPAPSRAGNGSNACGGVSSRMPGYLMSFTTPTTSTSVLVPGSLPNPICMPIGFRSLKNLRAYVSLITIFAGIQRRSLSQHVGLAESLFLHHHRHEEFRCKPEFHALET